MTMKQDSNPINNHPIIATLCGNCGADERNLLHSVRLRGNFRRLCTTCVLRLHPQCFCPGCFAVYDRSPPADAVVCYKCYSSSHPNCVTSSRAPPSPCASCLNPNAIVFNPKIIENGNKAIDINVSGLLLAAASISAMSMTKAEVAASAEAERRSKEAAYTKKRAREALDLAVHLMEKEKKNIDVYKKVGNASNGVVALPLVVVDAQNEVVTSNEVLEAALNAVELKENVEQSNGVVVMEAGVNNDKNLGVSSVTENGEKVGNGLIVEQFRENNHALEENVGLHPQN